MAVPRRAEMLLLRSNSHRSSQSRQPLSAEASEEQTRWEADGAGGGLSGHTHGLSRRQDTTDGPIWLEGREVDRDAPGMLSGEIRVRDERAGNV